MLAFQSPHSLNHSLTPVDVASCCAGAQNDLDFRSSFPLIFSYFFFLLFISFRFYLALFLFRYTNTGSA